jgi:broad specificity phosphatase PhoE
MPNTPIKFVSDLREMFVGEFQGKNAASIEWPLKKPLTGETFEQLFFRAKKFLDFLLEKHENEAVLVVGHNEICKAIICVLNKGFPEMIYKMPNLKNASISIFKIKNNSCKTILFNSVKHLI